MIPATAVGALYTKLTVIARTFQNY